MRLLMTHRRFILLFIDPRQGREGEKAELEDKKKKFRRRRTRTSEENEDEEGRMNKKRGHVGKMMDRQEEK